MNDEIRDAAAKKLEHIERYSDIATEDSSRKWLKSLAPLIESAKPVPEIEFRLSAMAQLLDFPAFCYTKETLRLFAEKHKFLPTYQELSEFLKGIAQKTKNEAFRCRKILQGQGPEKSQEPNYPEGDERTRLADKFAGLRSKITKKAEEV